MGRIVVALFRKIENNGLRREIYAEKLPLTTLIPVASTIPHIVTWIWSRVFVTLTIQHFLFHLLYSVSAEGVTYMKVKALVAQSYPTLCNPMDCSPLSMGFSRQEYWSGLPLPSPENLPNPGIKPGSPALQADSLPSKPIGNMSEGRSIISLI